MGTVKGFGARSLVTEALGGSDAGRLSVAIFYLMLHLFRLGPGGGGNKREYVVRLRRKRRTWLGGWFCGGGGVISRRRINR